MSLSPIHSHLVCVFILKWRPLATRTCWRKKGIQACVTQQFSDLAPALSNDLSLSLPVSVSRFLSLSLSFSLSVCGAMARSKLDTE
jgi:hypothetical protein